MTPLFWSEKCNTIQFKNKKFLTKRLMGLTIELSGTQSDCQHLVVVFIIIASIVVVTTSIGHVGSRFQVKIEFLFVELNFCLDTFSGSRNLYAFVKKYIFFLFS